MEKAAGGQAGGRRGAGIGPSGVSAILGRDIVISRINQPLDSASNPAFSRAVSPVSRIARVHETPLRPPPLARHLGGER